MFGLKRQGEAIYDAGEEERRRHDSYTYSLLCFVCVFTPAKITICFCQCVRKIKKEVRKKCYSHFNLFHINIKLFNQSTSRLNHFKYENMPRSHLDLVNFDTFGLILCFMW